MRSAMVFQSTRPIRGATPNHGVDFPNLRISIHAPHTGRDEVAQKSIIDGLDFNPRAPYGARPTKPWKHQLKALISIHAPHTGRDPV